MLRHLLAAGFALLVLVLVPTAQAAEKISIREVDTEGFPQVDVTVSVGKGQIDTGELSVVENGRSLQELGIEELTESGATVEVVLVMDTSGSMQGAPMASAIKAASAFIKEMPSEVRVGVVSFSDGPRVLQRPTLDQAAALDAVTSLKAQGETALYDAIVRATSLFTRAAQKNLVLLSDGGDTVSDVSLSTSVASADRAKTAVFAVSLNSPESNEKALTSLASKTNGSFSKGVTADLSEIYADLASELTGQFVISYESEVGGEQQVNLQVAGPLGTDSAVFLAPQVEQVRPAPAPKLEDDGAGLALKGAAGLAVALGVTFMAIFVLAVMFLGARARSERNERLARAIGKRKDESVREESTEHKTIIPEAVTRTAAKILQNRNLRQSIDRLLERAGSQLRPEEFLGIAALAALGGMFFGRLITSFVPITFVAAAAGASSPWLWMHIKAQKRTKMVQEQLPDVLGILASSLRAGHSFFQALNGVAVEVGPPADHEFSRAVAEIRLGRAVPEALEDLADRINSEDFRWALLAVGIQRQVGGNLAEILDTVAHTLRERQEIRRQVGVLSAEARLSAWILSGLPFLIGGYMMVIQPDNMKNLLFTTAGRYMVAGALTLMAFGALWMKRLVKIDV
jgi:tight adherence protein B